MKTYLFCQKSIKEEIKFIKKLIDLKVDEENTNQPSTLLEPKGLTKAVDKKVNSLSNITENEKPSGSATSTQVTQNLANKFDTLSKHFYENQKRFENCSRLQAEAYKLDPKQSKEIC